MVRSAGWLLVGVLALAGCGEGAGSAGGTGASPLGVSSQQEPLRAAGGQSGITVMTRNLYIGTDVFTLFGAPSASAIPGLVAQAYQNVQDSDPARRMGKIADEIVASDPDLVGLQEVELIRTQFPGDSLSPNPTPATDVAYDFLQLLLDALHERGADYVAVKVGQETDVELPALTTSGIMDVRLTDRDVLLARADVDTANAQAHHFAAKLSIQVGGTGPTIDILRGWVEADATVGNRTVHVANTHLEAANDTVQEYQALQLALALSHETRPLLLVGDFNSPADGSGSHSYALLRSAGYADLWLESHTSEPGGTCCNAADLRNEYPTYTERIDDLLFRMPLRLSPVGVQVERVGDELTDKTDGGLWPSDHAGVVGTVRIPVGIPFADR